MRIAFVNTLYPPHGASGAETTLRFLASRLRDRGHDCTVVTLTPEAAGAEGEVDGVPVRYLPLANVYWPHGGNRPRALRPVFQAIDSYNPVMGGRLRRALAAVAPDVANFHNIQGFSSAAWGAASSLRIPVVQTLHDYYTACPRSAMWRPGRGNCVMLCAECRAFGAARRRLSSTADAVTCVSHRVFDRLTGAGAFARAVSGAQPVRIIRGNNPDDALPDISAAKAEGGALRLGFMGRLDPSKGIENLLDAMRMLPPGSVHLSVAGKGPDDYARTLHARGQPRDDVAFLGHVAPATLFGQIDLLVVPSVWEDPFPRVFHEALAYGVPTLVTPMGGLPEAIRHGRNGFVTRAATPEALRDALHGLVTNGWDRAAMRAACRADAALYAPDRIVGQYEAVLAAAARRASVPEDAGERWQPRRPAVRTGL